MSRYISYILVCILIGLSGSMQAQISIADTDTIPNTDAAPDAVPAIVSKYNTPSKSYKAERNDIRKGNKYFEENKFHEALQEYDRALEVNGSSIRARYNKAITLLQLQSDDNKGTSSDPRVQAMEILGNLLPDAIEFDKEVAQKTFYNLGNLAFNDEKYDQSIEAYKSSLRIKPDDLEARQNLRLAQLKKQQQQNQDQQDNQDQKQDQDQQDQQQQQQQNQDQNEEQQQQQQEQKPMTNSAQQILQTMQNKENATRKKVQAQEEPAAGRYQPEKPW